MPTLVLVAPDDRPVFEASFPQPHTGVNAVVEQLVLHSSLDVVDEKVRPVYSIAPLFLRLPFCLDSRV